MCWPLGGDFDAALASMLYIQMAFYKSDLTKKAPPVEGLSNILD
jgi:hypothetical protein